MGGNVEYDWQVDANGEWVPNPQPPEPQWLRKLLGTDFFTAPFARDIHPPVQRVGPSPYPTAGLEYLPGLPQLRRLGISETKVTATEGPYLKGLNQLQRLNLINLTITDAGLEEVGKLTQLQRLDIFCTNVSDSGLVHSERSHGSGY